MKEIIRSFKKATTTFDPEAFYLFMVDKSSTGNAGYMPRKHRYGFIYMGTVGDKSQTIAHELGHGAFRLQHTFEEYPTIAETTQNLMDYGRSTTLRKYQWDLIHNPPIVIGLVEDLGEGALDMKEIYIDEYIPKFEDAHLSFGFTIPSNTYFMESIKVDINTISNTTFEVKTNEHQINMLFHPYLFININIIMSDNLKLKNVIWDFGTASISEIHSNFEDEFGGLNLDISKEEFEEEIRENFEPKMKQSEIGTIGYNPLNDNDIASSIGEVLTKLSEEDPNDTNQEADEITLPNLNLLDGLFFKLSFKSAETI